MLGIWLGSAASNSAQPAKTVGLESELQRFTVAIGLKLELFTSEPLLANPVAVSIDGDGRMFSAGSHRWATSVFDITQHTDYSEPTRDYKQELRAAAAAYRP